MNPKPISRRRLAWRDIEEIVDYYREEAPGESSEAFLDVLEKALDQIYFYPATGSTRYAHELGLPRLRSVVLKPFPYLIFYSEHETHVEIWRVLHARRDIAAWIED